MFGDFLGDLHHLADARASTETKHSGSGPLRRRVVRRGLRELTAGRPKDPFGSQSPVPGVPGT